MELKGSKLFRSRIVLSFLLGKDIVIKRIRSKADSPGIKDYEFRFLKLIEAISSGSRIHINETGTVVRLSPGILINNPSLEPLSFDCGEERGIGYFLEGILPLTLFAKNDLKLSLSGLTNTETDFSVDMIQYAFLPLLKHFGASNISIKIISRGDTCQVLFQVQPIRSLQRVDLVDPGKIKRVRGVAYSCKVSVQLANRVSYASKGFLFSFLPDIWIHSDHYKSQRALLGITLAGESLNGAVFSTEFLRGEDSTIEDNDSEVPEDLANLVTVHLLDEILHAGFVDSNTQALAVLLLAISGGNLLVGRMSQQTIEILRLIKEIANIEFEFEDQEEGKVVLKCIGLQLENIARKAV